jgi:hypothetical protein
MLLWINAVTGQTTMFEDNFEAYSNGAKIAQAAQAAGINVWTTWSGAVGGGEDGTVVTEQAHQGTKSLKIVADNDVILKLIDPELGTYPKSGAYQVSFNAYVPTAKSGYFNFLHVFDGAASEHCFEIYLNVAGTLGLNNATTIIGNYPHDAWFPVVVDVDMNKDTATLTINNVLLRTWKWSLLTTGGQGEKQLGALDLFGHETACALYVDEVKYVKTASSPGPAIVTFDPATMETKIGSNQTNTEMGEINNIGIGDQAMWSGYVKYPNTGEGTQQNFQVNICDEYSAGASGIGFTNGNIQAAIAMKLSPSDYANYVGGSIDKVHVYLGLAPNAPESDVTVKIYNQGTADYKTGALLTTKVLPQSAFYLGDWNAVTLDTPVPLLGGEIWVVVEMYQNTAGAHPLQTDGGPAVEGGDWTSTNGGPWMRLHESNPTLSYNWAIKATGSGKVRPGWVFIDKAYGFTDAGSSTAVNFAFKSGSYPDGAYNATFILTSNDVTNPVLEVPVIMNVDNTVANPDTTIQGIKVDGRPATQISNTNDYRITIDHTDKINVEVETTYPAATASGDVGEVAVVTGKNQLKITVTAEDGIHVGHYNLEVTVWAEGINEIEADALTMTISPNPVIDILEYTTDEHTIVNEIYIYDIQGKLVKESRVNNGKIDISALPLGMYLLKAVTNRGEVVRKVVKQ